MTLSRPLLLTLQLLVAVAFIGFWHVATAYPVLGDVKTMKFSFRHHGTWARGS